MKFFFIAFIFIFNSSFSEAEEISYDSKDSTLIMQLLIHAPADKNTHEYMYYFGQKLKNTPYVAKTLEGNKTEKLVINLRELDCTTYVENLLALSLCMNSNKKTFYDFTFYLRMIRYHDGIISYISRLHYFTSWINNNKKNMYVTEDNITNKSSALFSGIQTLKINYMTQHISQYPALLNNALLIPKLKKTELALTGSKYSFIPKSMLNKYNLMKKYIHNGDIIVILTSKKGLDTSHLGIASWHSDGTLHLLNASQIHKKVVDETMSIYNYMKKHPSQIGIRVIHPF